MKYVLDASVAVAAVRPNEAVHHAARARVAAVLDGHDEIAVPAIFPIEVGAALARGGWTASSIERFVSALLAPPTELVTIGPERARRIRRIAVGARLRAADAAYVWLASRRHLELVTGDEEMITRGGLLCPVVRP